nr:protein unc-13 homolog [Ipomoea batatas]
MVNAIRISTATDEAERPAGREDDEGFPESPHDMEWPFGRLEGLDTDDFREAAYEIFFTACRSSPGFGGRTALSYYNPTEGGGGGDGSWFGSGQESGTGSPRNKAAPGQGGGGVGMAVTSRVKRALGLKMLRRSPSRRANSCSSLPTSPSAAASGGSPKMNFTAPSRSRRPMTSAEIMRRQMKVTEQSDNRLRKTLMRTLVGQMGRRAETIILPLELLRHLKPSEFNDPNEYHSWQKRQLKILEAGLLRHPAVPLDKSNTSAQTFKEIIEAAQAKPIDTGKNSEVLRNLVNCVVTLSWRSFDGLATDICHWADGFPLNVHIYMALLGSIFDMKDETLVLDEIDELLELMKKTWSTLGMNRSIHNLCFTWVLFEQYFITTQMLGDVLSSMKQWSEKRLLDYHRNFDKGNVALMENILPLVFLATKILEEDVPGYATTVEAGKEGVPDASAGNRLDHCIRSSMRNAFAKMLEERNINAAMFEKQEASETLIKLADATEELAAKEKEIFSSALKKWHPIAAGVAALTLHNCYGNLLKQYMAGASTMAKETVQVLQKAGKLEKVLVQMVVEDSVECEDGGKTIVREMVPYEVDAIFVEQVRQWIQERVKTGKENFQSTKDSETWNPKSKNEPYAQSAVELMKHAKETVETFFELPVNITDDLVQSLAEGLDQVFREYISFVGLCGSKQNYIPTLPPLTRCSQDSRFFRLWKKGACSVGVYSEQHRFISDGSHHVSEASAYRLIFLDSNAVLYGSLYVGDVENARIHPALRILKQNLTLLCAIVTERAQPTAIKEVMKATFEAYLMVLLAGGSSRVFCRSDHQMIEEDFDSLKKIFSACAGGEGTIAEDVVDREAETVEGVLSLMSQSTEQLIEDFSTLACETSGMGVVGAGQKLPMPPTTGKWHRSDPNTILRVLCYRNDKAANFFLKKSFHLAKRRG